MYGKYWPAGHGREVLHSVLSVLTMPPKHTRQVVLVLLGWYSVAVPLQGEHIAAPASENVPGRQLSGLVGPAQWLPAGHT